MPLASSSSYFESRSGPEETVRKLWCAGAAIAGGILLLAPSPARADPRPGTDAPAQVLLSGLPHTGLPLSGRPTRREARALMPADVVRPEKAAEVARH